MRSKKVLTAVKICDFGNGKRLLLRSKKVLTAVKICDFGNGERFL